MRIRWMLLIGCVVSLTVSLNAEAKWKKYVHNDGSFSFHYPDGYTIETNDSIIKLDKKKTDEEILIIALPQSGSARESADWMVEQLKQDNAGLKAFGHETTPAGEGSVLKFNMTYSDDGKPYDALGMILRDPGQTIWFSYSCPSSSYSVQNAAQILMTILQTIEDGSNSKPPQETKQEVSTGAGEQASTDQINRNARAFMFTLEFALGAPFTQSQEDIILDELLSGWRGMSQQEMAKFDAYQGYVQSMMTMNSSDLDSFRKTLEQTTREWLNESDPSDPAVKAIKNHLSNKGKVLAEGDIPLTIMAADAYAEMVDFSSVLADNPGAVPGRPEPAKIARIREALSDAWSGFSHEQREQVARLPGTWIVLRRALEYGSSAERNKARKIVTDAFQSQNSSGGQTSQSGSGNAQRSSGSSSSSSGNQNINKQLMNNYIQHQTLMQMNQTTFNTYMWSRGFNYQPATGKMW